MTSHIDSLTQQDNVVTNDVPDTRTASEHHTDSKSLPSSDESSASTTEHINIPEHSFVDIDQELDSLLKDKPYEDKQFDSTLFASENDDTTSSPPLSSSIKSDDSKEDKDTEFKVKVLDVNIYLDDTNLRAGEKLGKIRESKDLSLSHIANKLYLNPHVIEALENGEYSQIASPIFVRGYLRNYAKFLDVAPESIIEQVNKELGHQPLPQIIPQAIHQSTPTEATHRTPFMLISSIIIAVITLVMVGLWASSPERNFPSFPDLNQLSFWSNDSTEEDGNDDGLTDPNFTDKNSDRPIPLSSVGNSSFQSNGEGTVFTPPSEAEATDNTAAGTTLGQPVPLSAAVSSTPLTDISANPSATATTETVVEEVPAKTVDLNTVSIHFTNRTWTSVLDSTGKEFFGRTAKAGSDHSFTGSPPFRLKFGMRNGIAISYAGEKIDFASSAKRRGKRITIGQAAE